MRSVRSRPSSLVACCAVAGLAFASQSARADGATPSIAEALFRDAREAMRAGDYATACPKLAESQRLDPSAGTLLNLALCEEKRGRIATAWSHYHGVLDVLPAGDARAPIAQDGIAAIEPRLPRLRIATRGATGAVTVSLDGTALAPASIGPSLPIDPGEHQIDGAAAGARRSLHVTLREGEQREAVLDFSAPAGAISIAPSSLSTPMAPSAKAPGATARTAGYVIGGAGALSVVASIVFGVLVLDRKSTVDVECVNKRCSPAGLSAGRQGATFDALANVTFAGGLVAIGAGTYLVLSAPKGAPGGSAGGPMLQWVGAF